MKDMKKIYTMAAGFLLCAGLVSCEMKKELFDNEEIPTETGLVELGVEVDDKTNVVITKAEATEDGVDQGTPVDPSDFPVSFTLKTNTNYNKELIYSDIKGKTVELPIGTYEVVSHTPGEMGKQMSTPYYKGSNELTVTKEATQQAEVICTMQNSRIAVVYPPEFQDEFTEWTITIDDGTGNVLKFIYDKDHQNLNPDAIYWAIAENCSSISISIKATTKSGASVSETRSVTKPADAADKNWVGGDALTITMQPVEANTGHVSGINIVVSTFFTNENDETVEAPLGEEETTTPTDPDDGEEGETGETTDVPTITIDQKSYTLPADNGKTANVVISAPAGLKSVKVKITPASQKFGMALSGTATMYGIDFLSGAELINCDNLESIISGIAPGIKAPSRGETEYTFPIGSFFDTLIKSDVTTAEGHAFEITVIDNNDNTVEDKVNVIVTEE